jgi:hypothetical protein
MLSTGINGEDDAYSVCNRRNSKEFAIFSLKFNTFWGIADPLLNPR